jgi:hypothetical protein
MCFSDVRADLLGRLLDSAAPGRNSADFGFRSLGYPKPVPGADAGFAERQRR